MRAGVSAAACSGMPSGGEAFDDFDEVVLGSEVLGATECGKRCMKVKARLAESHGNVNAKNPEKGRKEKLKRVRNGRPQRLTIAILR